MNFKDVLFTNNRTYVICGADKSLKSYVSRDVELLILTRTKFPSLLIELNTNI